MSTSHLVTNWPRKLQETTVHRTHFKHFNMASPLMFDNFEFHSFRNQKHQQKWYLFTVSNQFWRWFRITVVIPIMKQPQCHHWGRPTPGPTPGRELVCVIFPNKNACRVHVLVVRLVVLSILDICHSAIGVFNPSITWILFLSSIWNMTASWNKAEKVHQLGYLTFELVIGLLSFTSINSQLGFDEHHWN